MNGNFTNVLGNTSIHLWQNSITVAFIVVNCTVLFLTLIIGIAANLFVAWAVYNQKSLRTSNNALLVNLAVIDLLRCATDCPLLLVIILGGRNGGDIWIILCNGQVISFSLSCCVQLLTLACISAERYQAIAHPFKTSERRKRIMTWIPLTWTISILISVLCVLFAKDSPVYVRCKRVDVDTLKSYDTFGLYVLIPVWSICLVIIICFYTRIFFLVKAHSRKVFDKGTFISPGEKRENEKKMEEEQTKEKVKCEPEITTKPDDSQLVPEATETTDNGKMTPGDSNVPCCSDTAEKNRDATSEPIKTTDVVKPGQTEHLLSASNQNRDSSQMNSNTNAPQLIDLEGDDGKGTPQTKEDNAKVEELSPLPAGETRPSASPAENADQNEEVVGAVCMMPSLANRERGIKNKESKLAKRSGYIILTFLLFWIPLIATVLLNFFIHTNADPISKLTRELEILSVSLCCMTSVTNPIIYAAVNPQFQNEFHNLKTRCKALWTKT
ncbi:uncharacterized protein LOC115826492 [Chanos chanos]|uniref:Uncharacterized protein LOC115826492 n=1 Tax=Chanos chanos TaxID=29144 RepID=A0A6J2WPJ6_CHACN|nr:uncharacterized protein LOC115826492 [Chanos chanos]